MNIKEIATLREPKARRETGLILIDGEREIRRAAAAGVEVLEIVYCPDFKGAIPKGAQAVEVSNKAFEKIAYGERSGSVCAIARPRPKTLAGLKLSSNPLLAVVESVEKPGNLGAILRTCDGAGVEALLLADPKTDIYNPNVIRASAGTVFTVPVVAATSEDIMAFLRKNKIKALGTFPDAKELYTRADLKGPLAVVLGAEDKGLSKLWQSHCDLKVRVPMKGRADSLNVSVSTAVVLYEALRQRS